MGRPCERGIAFLPMEEKPAGHCATNATRSPLHARALLCIEMIVEKTYLK
jgi:hypothetical protein